MPRQYVVCGRLVPRLGARHVSLLLVILALFAIFSQLLTLPGAAPVSSSLRAAAGHQFSIPKSLKSPWLNKLSPFRQPSHPPPRQKNDTDGESVWYADWRWLLTPFGSSVTLEEGRALLPMLAKRTPIYCYYDNSVATDRPTQDADSELLLAWRRAWWAQGFKPVILSPAEAMSNPLYDEVQKLPDVTPKLKADLMRWLAWDNMGNGLLAHHLLFPMGPYDDPLLTYLRRAEFPKLMRFQSLEDGLYVGSKNEVTAAIKLALGGPHISKVDDVVAAVESDEKESPFEVDSDAPKSLAYYSTRQIDALYAKVGEAITASRASGLRSLAQLITAHLHVTWQNIFSDGIAVVKPLPQHTTHLITPAYELALRLAHCLESPLPDSCPPNRLKCRLCDDAEPMKITTPAHYDDSSTVYTIGAVPHPYTTSTLTHLKDELSIPWIRRESPRDAWLTSLTSSLFPDGAVSNGPRLRRFKEAVAATPDTSPNGAAARSLWLPAEQAIPDDLDWHFGFALPDAATYADPPPPDVGSAEANDGNGAGTSSDADLDVKQPSPNPNSPPKQPAALHAPKEGPLPSQADLSLEPALLFRAQSVVLHGSSKAKPAFPSPPPSSPLPPRPQQEESESKEGGGGAKTMASRKEAKEEKPEEEQEQEKDLRLRSATEAWNLADTEAWRFVRAHAARASVERARWEEDEAKYVGGVGSERRTKKTKTTRWGWR